MIVEFLISMKLCERVTPEMMRSTNLCALQDTNSDELLFFPALMSYQEKPIIEQPFQFGWCLQCTNQCHYFSPRFLHLLILRLGYQYALCTEPDNPHNRRCTIWSTGIMWRNGYGVNTLVELVDNNQCVILLMYSYEGLEHHMIHVRGKVISDVLSIQQEQCPSLHPKEFIIDPSGLYYPIIKPSNSVLYDIEAIASSVIDKKPCVLSYTKSGKGTHVEKLLSEILPKNDRDQNASIFLGRNLQVCLQCAIYYTAPNFCGLFCWIYKSIELS